MQELYKSDFQFLYNACFTEHDRGKDGIARFLRITDEGVFYDDCLQEGGEALKSLRWKPVHELAGPNKPPSSGPALPFPFTAKELAAFMLWGYWASDFQNTFGLLDCGPNEFVLNGDHEDAADAYEALRQAYVIYRDALHVVGELDYQERQRAYDLRAQFSDAYDQALEREKVMERVITGCRKDGSPEYGDFIQRDEYLLRLARAKESVASQKAQALQAEEQADAKERAWRKSMTRQLLQTQATTPSTAPEPQATPVATVGASDGVVTDKAGPGWSLKTSIKRTPGYRWPLYEALRAAHIAGQPCPKAQHFLDTWKLKPPTRLEVIQLPTRDELEYELETGIKKRVTVKQIQAAIKGLLSK